MGCAKIGLMLLRNEEGLEKVRKRSFLSAFFLLILIIPSLSGAESIRWLSYQDGMAKGKSENKKIFLNFYADW